MQIKRITLADQKALLNKLIKQASRSLKNKPEGTLQIARCNGTFQYYCRSEKEAKHRSYISKKEKKKIQSLAQKDYDQKFFRAANKLLKEIEALEKLGGDRSIGILYQTLNKVYNDLGEARKKLVIPYIKPDDEFIKEWESQEYKGNSYELPNEEIITEKGEYVRSKSEKIIADKLLSMHIPYLYEFPLRLETGEIVYPDFTILHVRERRLVIMEHNGRMHDEKYSIRTLNKMNNYEDSDYEEGYNLIHTFESDNQPLNIKRVERKLKRMLL